MLKQACHRGVTLAFFAGTLFMAAACLGSATAHAFGRKPVTTPAPTPTPSPTPAPVDVIRARWEAKNRDGAAWSTHVYNTLPTLAPNLLNKLPADMSLFCPNYANLSAGDQRNFWVYFLSSITELESGQDPTQTYTENFKDQNGNYVISTGLLQISLESGNGYGCGFTSTEDIKDPIKNLDCGLRILNKWIGKDGVIEGHTSTYLGGSRYWSTLRASKAQQIEAWTSALRMCGQ